MKVIIEETKTILIFVIAISQKTDLTEMAQLKFLYAKRKKTPNIEEKTPKCITFEIVCVLL